MKQTKADDRTFRIFATVVVVLGLLMLVALRLAPQKPNRCPFDGQVAEWTKRRDNKSCDYGHFNNLERTYHTWSAACP